MVPVSTPGGIDDQRADAVAGGAAALRRRVAARGDDEPRAAQHAAQRGARAGEAARDRDLGAVEDDAVGDAEARAEEPERQHGVEQDQVDRVVRHARAHRRQVRPAVGKKRMVPGTRSMRTPRSACSASKAAAPSSDDAVSTTKEAGSSRSRGPRGSSGSRPPWAGSRWSRAGGASPGSPARRRRDGARRRSARCRSARPRAEAQRRHEPGALEHAHGARLVGVDDHGVIGLPPEEEA